MLWSILADATAAARQNEPLSIWTLIFSGIAALGGIAGAAGGILSAVYTTKSARKKAERELLAIKLEMLFGELKDEITETMKAVEIVDDEVKNGTPVSEIYENNVESFRPIWSEANRAEILVSLYFEELMPVFSVFR
jgi:gas vesicle protein